MFNFFPPFSRFFRLFFPAPIFHYFFYYQIELIMLEREECVWVNAKSPLFSSSLFSSFFLFIYYFLIFFPLWEFRHTHDTTMLESNFSEFIFIFKRNEISKKESIKIMIFIHQLLPTIFIKKFSFLFLFIYSLHKFTKLTCLTDTILFSSFVRHVRLLPRPSPHYLIFFGLLSFFFFFLSDCLLLPLLHSFLSLNFNLSYTSSSVYSFFIFYF